MLVAMPGSRDGTRAGKAAVELRVSGASYAEVAEVLAMSSPREALMLVERELESHLTPEKVEIARAEAAAQLDYLLSGVWEKATTSEDPEHLPALRQALAIVDRRIRLFGLDKPTQIEIHTPTAAELERWVAQVTSQGTPEVLEADVVGELGP